MIRLSPRRQYGNVITNLTGASATWQMTSNEGAMHDLGLVT